MRRATYVRALALLAEAQGWDIVEADEMVYQPSVMVIADLFDVEPERVARDVLAVRAAGKPKGK